MVDILSLYAVNISILKEIPIIRIISKYRYLWGKLLFKFKI